MHALVFALFLCKVLVLKLRKLVCKYLGLPSVTTNLHVRTDLNVNVL